MNAPFDPATRTTCRDFRAPTACGRLVTLTGTPQGQTDRECVTKPTERQDVTERRDVDSLPDASAHPIASNRLASPGSDTFRFLTPRSESPIHAQAARSEALRECSGHGSGHGRD